MEITSWNDLKNFANNLTGEELNQKVFIYPDNYARIEVCSVSIAQEDLYCEAGMEEEGCFKELDYSKNEFEEMDIVKYITIGDVLVDVNLNSH